MTTKEAAKIFGELAALLEISGENSFKIRAYDAAIQKLNGFDEHISQFLERVKQKDVKGFGNVLAGHLQELIESGTIRLLEELRGKIPLEFRELLGIKGLSGKKLKLLKENLGINDLKSLKKACIDGSISTVKGYAEKSISNLLASIQFYEENRGFFRHSEHERILELLLSLENITLRAIGKSVRKDEFYKEIELCGLEEEHDLILEKLKKINASAVKKNKEELLLKLQPSDVTIRIKLSSKEKIEEDAFHLSCTGSHISYLKEQKKDLQIEKNFSTPEMFYKSCLTPAFPAEMRDGLSEKSLITFLEKSRPELLTPGMQISDYLISPQDIKGVIHVHSQYSDGVHTIEELANAAIKYGFSYLGITDHSKSAAYAGGLSEDDIKRQHEEIDLLNEKLKPFTILKGIESDILKNGDLDYKTSVLESFDFIIASVHGRFNQSKDEMTKRIQSAVENPYTSILGHPTGRLLLERPAYDFDISKILQSASEHGTAIELNSNPKRLDIPWRHLDDARALGVKICINPDAHSTEHFKFIKYGVTFARKAGYLPENIINTLDIKDFVKILSKKP